MPKILAYHQEVYRKLLHISTCITIVIFTYSFGKHAIIPWIIAIAILFPIIDYSRKYFSFLNHISNIFFRVITRPYEYRGLSGASWVLLGAGMTLYFFNENSAIIAILILGFSDSASALIGIKYGNTHLLNKSLEGSLSFLITTYVILFLFSEISFILLMIATITSTVIELLSTPKFNDNILIPFTIALILALGDIF